MPRLMFLMVLLLAACGLVAEDAIQGTFVGDWSGGSAGGKFKLSVARENGKPKCTVNFTYSGEDISTNVMLCKIDGGKIAQYDFDLGGSQLQSTIRGELKGKGLEGKYQTKVLDGGEFVDQGDWKVAPVP
jgi:hypothetical protein